MPATVSISCDGIVKISLIGHISKKIMNKEINQNRACSSVAANR